MSVPSRATLLVLDHLKGTDGRSLLKEAVKELVARDVLRVETQEPKGRGRKAKTRIWLFEGEGPVPEDPALRVVLRHVQAAPSTVHDGRVARKLSAVAKHLAREGAGREVLEAAIADLTTQGLVLEERRRVLGIVPRKRLVRTPAGDELLARSGRPGAAVDSGGSGSAGTGGDGGSDHDRDGHQDQDAGLDGSMDGAFDGAFDSAFEQSFDSAFDAGFSDGGGGGGDGGGGGGGGGDGGGGGG